MKAQQTEDQIHENAALYTDARGVVRMEEGPYETLL